MMNNQITNQQLLPQTLLKIGAIATPAVVGVVAAAIITGPLLYFIGPLGFVALAPTLGAGAVITTLLAIGAIIHRLCQSRQTTPRTYTPKQLKKLKNQWLKKYKKNFESFREAPQVLKNDAQFVRKLVDIDAFAFRWVGKVDKATTTLAVLKDPDLFQYASDELKSDQAFVLDLMEISQNGRVYRWAASSVQGKSDIIQAAHKYGYLNKNLVEIIKAAAALSDPRSSWFASKVEQVLSDFTD